MKKNYIAAVSGLGNIAWRFDQRTRKKDNFLTHAFSHVNNARTTLAGGYSPDELERREFQDRFKVPVYESFEKLIDYVKPDIVSICSPTNYHFEQVMFCIEQEVPMIWLEKPPANYLDELDIMIAMQAAKNKKSKILVNYQRRYARQYQELKTIYEKESMGKCKSIQINYSRELELNGSHMLDILFFITGDNTYFNLEWASCEPQNPSFAISCENGAIVMVTGMILPYHNIDISMTFDDGRASVIHGGIKTVIEKCVEHELFEGFYRLKQESEKQLPAIENEMEAALKDLINAHTQDIEPMSNLASSRNTQALIQRIRMFQEAQRV